MAAGLHFIPPKYLANVLSFVRRHAAHFSRTPSAFIDLSIILDQSARLNTIQHTSTRHNSNRLKLTSIVSVAERRMNEFSNILFLIEMTPW
jgi:menaquinone-dependent protoporphyrinogen IX oxidase